LSSPCLMWCPIDREILTKELHSQPISKKFYCACAETAICEPSVKKFTPNLSSSCLMSLRTWKCVNSTDFKATYLLPMCRKRPLSYFRFKIWPKNWVPRIRFTVWPDILAIEPRFQPLLVNFLLRIAETATWLLLVSNLRLDLSSPCQISYWTWKFGNYTMCRAIFA